MAARDAFFDAQGNQVCKKCNARNEMGAAQERAIQSEKNERNNALAIGMPGVFSGAPRLAVRGFVAAARMELRVRPMRYRHHVGGAGAKRRGS